MRLSFALTTFVVLGCAHTAPASVPEAAVDVGCRPAVSAQPKVLGEALMSVRFTACALGTYRFRFISLGRAPNVRGLVRGRRTVVVKRVGPGRLHLRAPSLPGRYALSLQLPSGRKIRAARAVRVRRPPAGSLNPSCTDGRTLAMTSESRAFRVGKRVYACHAGQRRGWFVGHDGGDACDPDFCDIGPIALAGSWLAYGAENGGREGTQYAAVRMDLLTGRKVARIEAGALPDAQRYNVQRGVNSGRGPVTDLLIKANGSLALLYEDRFEVGKHGVVVDDQDGTRNVASAPDVRPGTLSLTGPEEVSWDQGLGRRSTPLR